MGAERRTQAAATLTTGAPPLFRQRRVDDGASSVS